MPKFLIKISRTTSVSALAIVEADTEDDIQQSKYHICDQLRQEYGDELWDVDDPSDSAYKVDIEAREDPHEVTEYLDLPQLVIKDVM